MATILANWDTSTPIASAKACLWRTFISLNSASEPTCFKASSCIPAKSPANANSLIFWRFNSLPIITEAVSSASSEELKSNKLFAIVAASPKDIPICLALTAAFAIFSPPPFAKEAISSDDSDISANTAPGATPADAARAAVCFKKFDAVSAEWPDTFINSAVSFAASSVPIPSALAVSIVVADISAASPIPIPSSAVKALTELSTSSNP